MWKPKRTASAAKTRKGRLAGPYRRKGPQVLPQRGPSRNREKGRNRVRAERHVQVLSAMQKMRIPQTDLGHGHP